MVLSSPNAFLPLVGAPTVCPYNPPPPKLVPRPTLAKRFPPKPPPAMVCVLFGVKFTPNPPPIGGSGVGAG